jgi:hypothetical protein
VDTLKSKDSSNILKREKVVEMTSNVVKITYNQFLKSKDRNDADTYIKAAASLGKLEGFDAPIKNDLTLTTNKPPIFGNDSLNE